MYIGNVFYKPFSQTDYTDWPRGQPNNAGGNEDCGEIRHDGRFNDLPCSTAIGYVCKKGV